MNPNPYLLLLVLALTSAPACRSGQPSGSPKTGAGPASASAAASPIPGLRVVEASKVCMVNDRYMGTNQIPTEVDGHTYYGCCAMCSGRLRGEPGVRSAKDPVSGEPVDKSSAVIAAADDGKVLYFKNAQTLAAYHR